MASPERSPRDTLDGSSMRSSASFEAAANEKQLSPPPLNYSLRSRKLAVAICWALVMVDSLVLAVVLYYPLVYGTNLELWVVMTIVTCLVGMLSLVQFLWRTWVLIHKDASQRPINGKRWQLDMFQWIYAAGVVIVAVELVFGTFTDEPNIALCSMPLASILFMAAFLDLIAALGYRFQWRTPVSVSSVARGEIFRPGAYTVIEDVIAVDGHGGLEYRLALDVRYRASPEFRGLLARMDLFWSIPALVVAAGTTAVVWTTSDPVAFGVGWTVPMIWLTLQGALTIPYCQRLLACEKEAWQARTMAA